MKSGTLTRQAGAFQFRLHWESVPNQSANSSTITAKLYYESINAYGVLGYTDARAATILINGNASNFTYTRNIGANGSKLIGTKTYTIQHNSDGTMSTPVGFSVNFGTTWAGTYYGTITASETAVLDKIERNSTINGTPPSFYFGQEEPIVSITRHNSTYKHKLKIDLYYTGVPHVNVYWSDFFATSVQIKAVDFDLIETLAALQRNQQYFSQNMRYTLFTYDANGNQLGHQEISGALLSSPGTRLTLSGSPYKIGGTMNITTEVLGLLSENDHLFKSEIQITTSSTPGIGYEIERIANVPNGVTHSVSLTSAKYSEFIGQTLYVHATPFGIDSIVKVRNTLVQSFNLQSGRPPVFSGSGSSIQYRDTNTLTTSITGNNQILVRGKSTMRVDLTTAPRATGQDGASVERYILSVGSRTYSYPASSVPSYVDHDVPSNAGSSFTWTAVDNRGQESSITKVVDIRDYHTPVINTPTARRTSPTTRVDLRVSGYISSVAGTNRVVSIKWGLSSTNLVNDMTVSFSGDMSGSYSGTATATIPEDATQSFYFQVTDSFGEKSVIRTVSVSGIQPLMFIDKDKKAVAIGMYPSGHNAKFEVAGNARLTGDLFIKESLSYNSSSITDGGNYVQFSTGRARYYFDKEVNMESNLVVSTGGTTTLNGPLSVSGNSILSTLSVGTSIDSSGKVNIAYNTDNGQLEIGSNATNYSTGLRLKRGTANTAIIEQNYSGYLNFEYDSNNYLRFGGTNSNSNIMNINNNFLQRTYGKHTILAMSNNEIWLQSSTTTFRVHGTNPGVYVRNFNDSAYNNIYAADFVKSSRREVKKNIETAPLGSFKDDVMSTPLYKYHYLDDLDTERLRLGFMMDEVPVDTIDIRGEGLDLAAQVATLWGALQEVILENEDMKARLLELEV